ncbi:uncharacterized protein MYCFIDRAFT_206956 [Pseudocercospora fijiensis CIRAD86]|uniref:Uncharacterized protein n=1 Tax=Pseudocercospora fijiensis (strain CIRAD86) TaxID=383855 RepID=M3BC19_PSEFD|nr:uncharacterized protein MYCFIDRAFT_206956 [Pseudocercospora fijiensis CIRAD86]EME86822.1 hypothetical protein MYCFIDRAFT_206956 [Pseudocercospora fijiensis CIRAD86]
MANLASPPAELLGSTISIELRIPSSYLLPLPGAIRLFSSPNVLSLIGDCAGEALAYQSSNCLHYTQSSPHYLQASPNTKRNDRLRRMVELAKAVTSGLIKMAVWLYWLDAILIDPPPQAPGNVNVIRTPQPAEAHAPKRDVSASCGKGREITPKRIGMRSAKTLLIGDLEGQGSSVTYPEPKVSSIHQNAASHARP